MINEETLYKRHIPDGAASVFAIGLEYLNDEDNIKITYFDGDNDTEYELTLGTNYTVDTSTNEITTITGAYGGGTLVSPIQDSTPSGLSKLTITLNAPYTQKIDITSNSNYDPETLELGYDNGVVLAKQNKEIAQRAVTLAISDAGDTMELPPKADLANGVLGFDSGGDPIARAGFIPEVWDALFEYSAGNIVQHTGDMWICTITDTGTEPGTETPAVIWEVYVDRKNYWNAAILYAENETVTHGGILYIATSLTGNVAKIPGTATTYWTEMNIYGTRWDPDVEYSINDVTSRTGVLVKSLQNSNKGNEPNLTPGATDTWWEIVKTGGSLETEGTVLAATAVNTAMYFDTDGKLHTADNRELSKSFSAGLLVTATTGADEVSSVLSGGLMDGFSGLTIGTDYYLGNTGNLITRGSIAYEEYIVYIGRATSATELDVKVRGPEPTRNQDDGNPVGSIKYFSTYKDRSAYGYLPFAFDNAISQANYPVLYAEIGDIYELQHTEAGDSASGAGMFYPTPVPGAYDRVGIPDIEFTDAEVFNGGGFLQLDLSPTILNQTNFRSGTNIKVVLVSGTLPTGLTDGSLWFVSPQATDGEARLHSTEADAIANTNALAYTNSGSGTFRLTQEGIVLDDAFQGHLHDAMEDNEFLEQNAATGSIRYTPASTGTFHVGDPIEDDKGNGTPRTTNETRPKTNYSFGYIKAEHVTSAGEPISALRYDTGWVANSDWTNSLLTVTHNLSENISNLIIGVYLSKTGLDSDSVKLPNTAIVFDQSTPSDLNSQYGLQIITIDNSAFKLNTLANGLMGELDGSGLTVAWTTQSYFYKVIVTKPNLINTVFDVSNMPKTYDLTSANIEVALPARSGVLQTRDIFWTNGGTYKLTIREHADDGGALLDYEGEGEGNISLTAGSSAWLVKEYGDSGSIADSGVDINRKYYKYVNRKMVQIGQLSTTDTAVTAKLECNPVFGKTFNTIDHVNPPNFSAMSGTEVPKVTYQRSHTLLTTSFTLNFGGSSNFTNPTVYIADYEAIGTW